MSLPIQLLIEFRTGPCIHDPITMIAGCIRIVIIRIVVLLTYTTSYTNSVYGYIYVRHPSMGDGNMVYCNMLNS